MVAAATPAQERLSAADRLAVAEAVARMSHALGANDIEAYLDAFAPGAEFLGGAGPAARGREEIRVALSFLRAAGVGPGARHATSDMVIEGTPAGARARYVLMLIDRAARPALIAAADATTEFARRGGAWLATRHAVRFDQPPPRDARHR